MKLLFINDAFVDTELLDPTREKREFGEGGKYRFSPAEPIGTFKGTEFPALAGKLPFAFKGLSFLLRDELDSKLPPGKVSIKGETGSNLDIFTLLGVLGEVGECKEWGVFELVIGSST